MKRISRIATDLLMTAMLLLLMSYSLVGEAAHEWLGVGIFLLFLLHHFLNKNWYKSLFHGKYPPIRTLQTVIDLLILLCMAGSMISGILLSRYVFRLDIHRFSATLQAVHMLLAYWGFALLSMHLGLHWGSIMSMIKKLAKKPSKIRKWAFRGVAFLIAAYGAYVFVKRDFGNYMLLRYHFVFFDDEPLPMFLLDYVAIMGLFVWAGYYLAKAMRKSHKAA